MANTNATYEITDARTKKNFNSGIALKVSKKTTTGGLKQFYSRETSAHVQTVLLTEASMCTYYYMYSAADFGSNIPRSTPLVVEFRL